jgi:hypothetical protein
MDAFRPGWFVQLEALFADIVFNDLIPRCTTMLQRIFMGAAPKIDRRLEDATCFTLLLVIGGCRAVVSAPLCMTFLID